MDMTALFTVALGLQERKLPIAFLVAACPAATKNAMGSLRAKQDRQSVSESRLA